MVGFYNIIKPTGLSSAQAVAKVKKITSQKCGHLGTLDTAASGVLPVAVGKATKLFDWFLNKDKTYFAIGLFGVLTDTLDSEGVVINRQFVDVKKTQIDKVLSKFCGKITQYPPIYSAININGQRAYDLAREGKTIDLPPREVNIYSLICKQLDKNLFSFNIHCSAGTYVRSLILDIAKEIGTFATTVCIIRTDSGGFNLPNATTLEDLQNGKGKLIKVDEVVNLPKIELDQSQKNKLINGQIISVDFNQGKVLCVYNEKIVGIAEIDYHHMLKLEVNLWEEESND